MRDLVALEVLALAAQHGFDVRQVERERAGAVSAYAAIHRRTLLEPGREGRR